MLPQANRGDALEIAGRRGSFFFIDGGDTGRGKARRDAQRRGAHRRGRRGWKTPLAIALGDLRQTPRRNPRHLRRHGHGQFAHVWTPLFQDQQGRRQGESRREVGE